MPFDPVEVGVMSASRSGDTIAEKRTNRSAAGFHQTSQCDVQKVDGLGRSSQNEALEVPGVDGVVIDEHLGQSDPSHPDALDGRL